MCPGISHQNGQKYHGPIFGFLNSILYATSKKDEPIDFSLTKADVKHRNPNVMCLLSKESFGKLYADKGYVTRDFLIYSLMKVFFW